MRETVYRLKGSPRLALLSDLHGKPYKEIIEKVEKHRPSLICIPGDVVYGSQPEGDRSPLDTQDNIMPFLRACASIAPTYMSLGNHEWMLDEEDLYRIRSTGVVLLDNEWIRHDELRTRNPALRRDGTGADGSASGHDGLIIGGLTSGYVTDYRRYKASLDEAERLDHRYPRIPSRDEAGGLRLRPDRKPNRRWLKDFIAAPGYHILLSHHPTYISLIPRNVEMILCGHAHGGQIRYYSFKTRKWEGLFAPGQGLFPRYTSGVYKNRMIVSRGLANTAPLPRLFNPREIVFIEPM